ncbi:MAG TPA: imidazole glycerol phosphate synthase subunit HisH [Vicinamibacteria bacterium]|nr:imidazole glycerol phosphate synthase subunit HisH [Vicinamibacteria bacterium]
MRAPLVVVDYGIGNLGSALKAFRTLGAPAVLSGDPRALAAAAALVLPGDGAFGAAMDELRARGLLGPLLEAVRAGTPLLGICIGMQLLLEESEEMGRHRGLGLLPGRVRRLPAGLAVPHMGWNTLRPRRPHALFEGLGAEPYVYFVHSYYCQTDADLVLATTDYGQELPAVVGRGPVLGLQFHPEKSQAVGLRLLGNALRVLGVPLHADAREAVP